MDDLLQPMGVFENSSTVLLITSSGSVVMSDERRNHWRPTAPSPPTLATRSGFPSENYKRKHAPLPRSTCAILSCCFKKLFSFTSFSKHRSPSQLAIACRYAAPFSRGPT